jgi:transcriptional regulator GlxA family with amidase domain
MKVAYLLYPRFTALDVVGTFQVIAAAPGTRSVFVAPRAGAVVDDTGMCALQATASLGDVAAADVLVIPGSDSSCPPNPTLVEWIRVVHPTTTWTLSVGTGSSYLAAAGALDGATAATHWASAQRLTDAGVTYSKQRVVQAGKVLTSAGASAGIDLALTLLGLSHGPAVAQTVQLALEYDPRPPYDAGTPAKAPADIGELVSSYYAQRCT